MKEIAGPDVRAGAGEEVVKACFLPLSTGQLSRQELRSEGNHVAAGRLGVLSTFLGCQLRAWGAPPVSGGADAGRPTPHLLRPLHDWPLLLLSQTLLYLEDNVKFFLEPT